MLLLILAHVEAVEGHHQGKGELAGQLRLSDAVGPTKRKDATGFPSP
jgi:hypothetical protein